MRLLGEGRRLPFGAAGGLFQQPIEMGDADPQFGDVNIEYCDAGRRRGELLLQHGTTRATRGPVQRLRRDFLHGQMTSAKLRRPFDKKANPLDRLQLD